MAESLTPSWFNKGTTTGIGALLAGGLGYLGGGSFGKTYADQKRNSRIGALVGALLGGGGGLYAHGHVTDALKQGVLESTPEWKASQKFKKKKHDLMRRNLELDTYGQYTDEIKRMTKKSNCRTHDFFWLLKVRKF